MSYWLTTHYPHPDPDTLPWHIYLQRDHKGAVAGITVGDVVFFYEYKYQKPIKGDRKHPVGRERIVLVAEVSGAIYERKTVVEHTNGTKVRWSWGVPTNNHDEKGFVDLARVLSVLGYRSGGRLRGFNAGKGVKRLDDEQGRSLMELFRKGAR